MRNESIITEPIEINIMFYMPIPKYTAGKKKVLMLDGTFKHTKKPDLDNILKFAMDCMNKIVYCDDKQIYSATAEKQYAIEPRTEMTLTWDDRNGK
jgi:Holliday junction resolvase RusA-like endonuclease